MALVDDLRLPVLEQATKGSSGFDIVYRGANVVIEPDKTFALETGFAMAIPLGFEGQIRSRSGLSKRGIIVANSPGTIDSDYRDQIIVLLKNTSKQDYLVSTNDRVAQIVFCPVAGVAIKIAKKLPKANSTRKGGLGSTGESSE